MVAGPALLLWIALAPFAAESPQAGENPRVVAKKILDEGRYQQQPPSTLTNSAGGEGEAGEGHGSAAGDRSGSGSRPLLSGRDPSGFLHAPLLVPIVVGAILLLFLLLGVTRRGGFTDERRSVRIAEAEVPAEAAAPDEGGDPDALAAEGRFADAIHALLLRALRGLARSLGGFARGLTSREILPRAPAGAARAALEELVAAVERHRFGARELSAADFERCRSAAAVLPRGSGDGLAKSAR